MGELAKTVYPSTSFTLKHQLKILFYDFWMLRIQVLLALWNINTNHSIHGEIHQDCNQKIIKRAIRTPVRLWCHNITVSSPGIAKFVKTTIELMQKRGGLCLLRLVKTNQSEPGARGLKETVVKTEHSEKGWTEVLRQWTVWEKKSVYSTLKYK